MVATHVHMVGYTHGSFLYWFTHTDCHTRLVYTLWLDTHYAGLVAVHGSLLRFCGYGCTHFYTFTTLRLCGSLRLPAIPHVWFTHHVYTTRSLWVLLPVGLPLHWVPTLPRLRVTRTTHACGSHCTHTGPFGYLPYTPYPRLDSRTVRTTFTLVTHVHAHTYIYTAPVCGSHPCLPPFAVHGSRLVTRYGLLVGYALVIARDSSSCGWVTHVLPRWRRTRTFATCHSAWLWFGFWVVRTRCPTLRTTHGLPSLLHAHRHTRTTAVYRAHGSVTWFCLLYCHHGFFYCLRLRTHSYSTYHLPLPLFCGSTLALYVTYTFMRTHAVGCYGYTVYARAVLVLPHIYLPHAVVRLRTLGSGLVVVALYHTPRHTRLLFTTPHGYGCRLLYYPRTRVACYAHTCPVCIPHTLWFPAVPDCGSAFTTIVPPAGYTTLLVAARTFGYGSHRFCFALHTHTFGCTPHHGSILCIYTLLLVVAARLWLRSCACRTRGLVCCACTPTHRLRHMVHLHTPVGFVTVYRWFPLRSSGFFCRTFWFTRFTLVHTVPLATRAFTHARLPAVYRVAVTTFTVYAYTPTFTCTPLHIWFLLLVLLYLTVWVLPGLFGTHAHIPHTYTRYTRTLRLCLCACTHFTQRIPLRFCNAAHCPIA